VQEQLSLKKKSELEFKLTLIGVMFLCSLNISVCFSRTPDFQIRLEEFFLNNDISFEIESKQLKQLIFEKYKVVLGKISVKSNKGQVEVILPSLNLSKKIKMDLIENMKHKAQIVIGSDLQSWLEDYKFIEEHNGWYTYEDKLGVLDNKRIKVKFNKSIISLIELTPIGTNKTTYYYKKVLWAKKLVLESVLKETYDGLQKMVVETKLSYQLSKKNRYYVSKINQSSKQYIGEALGKKVERNLIEVFTITGFNQ
jgi:hypothetical protein